MVSGALALSFLRFYDRLNYMSYQNGYKKTIVCIGLQFLTTILYTQTFQYTVAGRYTALGAYSEKFCDVLSFTTNQAILGQIKGFGAAIYSERKFSMNELKLHTIAVRIPVRFGGIGISARSFGYDAYKENQFNLAYGKSLGNLNLGIQFNYYTMLISAYGKATVLTIEGGALLKLSNSLYAGLHIFNPAGGRFGIDRSEKLPSIYSSGFGCEVSEKVLLSAAIIKEESRPVNVHCGIYYAYVTKLFARLGMTTYPASIYFGAGWKWNNLRLEISFNYHSQLAFTPGLMFQFEANKKVE